MLNKSLNKNELLGVGNILFGIGYLYSQYHLVFKQVPVLTGVFESFNSPQPPLGIFYVIAAIFTVIGIANLYLGVKLFQNNKSESLFNRGIIMLVISILGIGVFAAISTILVIGPIYNLTESL